MSLEEKIERLATSIDMLVDAAQYIGNILRQQTVIQVPPERPAQEAKAVPEPAKDTSATAEAPGKRKPGRPPKSPVEQASLNVSSDTQSAASTTQAPSSGSSSAAATYDDLKVLVPQVAEKHGRSRAVAIFGELGVASGQELLAKFPDKVGEAVARFRAAL